MSIELQFPEGANARLSDRERSDRSNRNKNPPKEYKPNEWTKAHIRNCLNIRLIKDES